jgi:hypothetical protein
MKCEKTTVTKNFDIPGKISKTLRLNDDEYYFSCVLAQKQNVHYDLFFTVRNKTQLHLSNDQQKCHIPAAGLNEVSKGLDKASLGNRYIKNEGNSNYGGQCTCPDGRDYWVAAKADNCNELACYGGFSGVCEQQVASKWAKYEVHCATSYMKISNFYVNYGDFVSLGPMEINSRQVAMVKRRGNAFYQAQNAIGPALPNTYVFLYNRTNYDYEMETQIKSLETEYRRTQHLDPSEQFPQEYIELLSKYKTALVHERFFNQNKTIYRNINGGIPISGRGENTDKNIKIFFEENTEGDYLAYTSYSYYPLSLYLMHDSTSIIIDKASNNKDIFVNVYNHYSYVKVQ